MVPNIHSLPPIEWGFSGEAVRANLLNRSQSPNDSNVLSSQTANAIQTRHAVSIKENPEEEAAGADAAVRQGEVHAPNANTWGVTHALRG